MATLYKEGVEGKYKWLTPKQAKKIRHSAGIQIDGGNRIVTPCKDIAKKQEPSRRSCIRFSRMKQDAKG